MGQLNFFVHLSVFPDIEQSIELFFRTKAVGLRKKSTDSDNHDMAIISDGLHNICLKEEYL